MDGRETPEQMTVRLTKQCNITEGLNAHDSNVYDRELDSFPYNVSRPEITREELIARLHNPAVARFFRPAVIEGINRLEEAA